MATASRAGKARLFAFESLAQAETAGRSCCIFASALPGWLAIANSNQDGLGVVVVERVDPFKAEYFKEVRFIRDLGDKHGLCLK